MYDPKLDEDLWHLFFIMTGALMCWATEAGYGREAAPMVTLIISLLCVAGRSWNRWRKGEWTV